MKISATQANAISERVSRAIDEHLTQRLENARDFVSTLMGVYLDSLAPEGAPIDEETFDYILKELGEWVNHQHRNTSLWTAQYGKRKPCAIELNTTKVASLFGALKSSLREELLAERDQRNAGRKGLSGEKTFLSSDKPQRPPALQPLEKFRN